LSLALAALFYQIGTAAHLAVLGKSGPAPFWCGLTGGLTHLAVSVVPLVWALAVVRYAVSRRLTARAALWLAVLVLAIIGSVVNLDFYWPDAAGHQVAIVAGAGYSTRLPWIGQLLARCLVFAGLAFAYRQWLSRRTWHVV
jgi:hypothetical protein